uniref:Uncharacterized protein n=1 Tax=Romanomermis culicivorax TaxID=13658 RepID=A0A915K2C1_ROMCU
MYLSFFIFAEVAETIPEVVGCCYRLTDFNTRSEQGIISTPLGFPGKNEAGPVDTTTPSRNSARILNSDFINYNDEHGTAFVQVETAKSCYYGP